MLSYVIEQRQTHESSVPEEVLAVDPDAQFVRTANRVVRERVTVWYDGATGRWKLTARDLRDIDKQLADSDLPGRLRARVSTTRETLHGQDIFVSYTEGTTHGVLGIFPLPANAIRTPPIHAGVIPKESLSKATNVVITEEALDHRLLTKVGVDLPGGRRIDYFCDPELNYRYVLAERRNADGKKLLERKNSDFRRVGDLWYPFRYEERHWNEAGDLTYVKQVTVESIRMDPPRDDLELTIRVPANTQITDVVFRKAAFPTYKPLIVDVDTASDIARRCLADPEKDGSKGGED